MNFKNNYNDSTNSVPRQKKSPAFIGRYVASAVLCVALICSVLVFAGEHRATPVSPVAIETAQNYNKIFKTVNKLKLDMLLERSLEAFTTNGLEKSAASDSAMTGEHSETTKQVDGVDEADIVKTDGKYIYSLSSVYYEKNRVNIIDTANGNPILIGTLKNENINISEMYLSGSRLILLGTQNGSESSDAAKDMVYFNARSAALIYDISHPKEPKLIETCLQSGYYSDSRLIKDKLYLISNYSVLTEEIKKDTPETYVPSVSCKGYSDTVPANSVRLYDECKMPEYTVICGYDIKDGKLTGTQSVLGGSFTVYCSLQNIITVSYDIDSESAITRFAIKDGDITLKASANIKGSLLNQFSIDEYKNYFRFVTTITKGIETNNGGVASNTPRTVNSVVILDEDLKQTGEIKDIAPNERVYSVRFMGDIAYFVTFRQVDPLFSVDLSNPAVPKIIGSLKIPGLSDYLSPYGNGKLLGIGRSADEKTGVTNGMKLSMFDISNPSNVIESSIIPVEARYSEALNNHKACLIDTNKNIIAFSVYDEIGMRYMIFAYDNGNFVKKADIRLKADAQNTRGVYIGDIFYIISGNDIMSYDMIGFKQISDVTL